MLQAMAGTAMTAGWPWDVLATETRDRLPQSVCLWCYNDFLQKSGTSLDDFAAACARLGLKSVELTGHDQWPKRFNSASGPPLKRDRAPLPVFLLAHPMAQPAHSEK